MPPIPSAAPLLFDLSPLSQGCAPPSPTYTSLRPSLVSNTHKLLSHLGFFAPTALGLDQNSSQSDSGASVGFTSQTSLLPCDICLDPEFPRNAILTHCLALRMKPELYLLSIKFYRNGGYPGCPVVRTLSSHCQVPGMISGWVIKIPHALLNNNNNKTIQYLLSGGVHSMLSEHFLINSNQSARA